MLTKLNKVGLVLAGLMGVIDLTSPFQPTPDGNDGPPYAVLVIDAALGLITIVAVVVAFRAASRGAVRLVAGSRIVSAVTTLPGLFADIPAGLKVLAALSVLITAAVVVMLLTPARSRAVVSD